MKIGTWNIERYKKSSRKEIDNTLFNLDVDLLTLTETSLLVNLNDYHVVHSLELPLNHDGQKYEPNENRVSIFSKFPIIKYHSTYDPYTSICCEIETPLGVITTYASIIGCIGGRGVFYKKDLEGQLNDYDRIFPDCTNILVVGDLNTSFSGYTYPSKDDRNTLLEAFAKYNLEVITADLSKHSMSVVDCNIDHIIINESLLSNSDVPVTIWNNPPKLSDHIGIYIEI